MKSSVSSDGGQGDLKFKEVSEVSFPSLDEALDAKFDLNNATSIC